MDQLNQINPTFGDKKMLVFVGIGALCAGILIGFKLAGGQKIELNETSMQLTPEPTPAPQETEAEND